MSEDHAIERALRTLATQARADYRAGLISLAECRRITRMVRETIGGE